jgi:hypothetical protein
MVGGGTPDAESTAGRERRLMEWEAELERHEGGLSGDEDLGDDA